ncbi:MAG: precorrin-6y C5,15-methyltransferase (decarboxylating) subunit CbiE [Thermodesulfobacteriota bacterium]
MSRVTVIGLGLGPLDVTPRARQALAASAVLAGGERLLAMFPDHPGRRLTLKFNLAEWLEAVAAAAAGDEVAVLASGDPGFFGIAQKLIARLGAEAVTVIPNVTALAAACARLGLAWQDARAVSLHGRAELGPLWRALYESDLVAVYTDPQNTPDAIARLLVDRGQAAYWRLAVAEDLGADAERVAWFAPDEAAGRSFSPLNVTILERVARPQTLRLGLAEDAYAHQAGLITKAEARAAALGLLELEPGLTLWDLGAGSGALGLEASLLIPGGRVVAVEADPDRAAMIRANRAAFGVGCLEVHPLRLPTGMDGLPTPDRVFVGGGGRDLGAIIAGAAARLRPGGVIVAAAVRLESLMAARQALAAAGLTVETTLIQAGRGAALTGGEYIKALNPVWLARGKTPHPGPLPRGERE